MRKSTLVLLALTAVVGTAAFAAAGMSGIGGVSAKVTTNFENVAKLITAGAYVAGMAFAVGAVVKFKAHKDNPTQIPIGTPIALLFVGAALIFVPTIFNVAGSTMFGTSGAKGNISGVSSF